ncbi:MAG: cysteine synthase A [Clostridia bacterium]|nr:cysteine synthase A [Clostridia bacterium]
MTIASSIAATIGRTPIVRLNRFGGTSGRAEILAKLESFNPGGSVKDRIALAMIDDAEARGALSPGGVIIEPTSGNTGVGLAMIAAARGYRIILTMPDAMSIERRCLLAAYGAEIVLTPGALGMSGAVARARELAEEHGDWFMPSQFENPVNPQTHDETTAAEIVADLSAGPELMLDAFVAGVGTGGTITGTSRALRRVKPELLVIGVEPAESAVLSGNPPGPHRIQGIGAGFIPPVLDVALISEIVTVRSDDAFAASRRLAREEGILAGISSGAVAAAALGIARRLGEGQRVLAIFPDTGERYLSVEGLF